LRFGRVINGKVVTLEQFNAHIKAQREASEP
jgi:hypothetical protein